MLGRPTVALAAIGAAIALLAGCGGEEEEGVEGFPGFEVRASTTVDTASPRLDKAQFLARVRRICQRGWGTILDNFAEYGGWQREDGLRGEALYAKTVRLSYLAGLDFHIFDEIYDLGGPDGEEEQIEEIIGEMQTAVELGQRRVRTPAPAELRELFADYNRLARGYGLDDCLVTGENLPRLGM